MSAIRNTRGRSWFTAAALGIGALIALAACSSGGTGGEKTTDGGAATSDAAATSEAADPTAAPGDIVLVNAIRSLSNPYHANWAAGGKIFADSVGLEQVLLSDEADSQRQLSQIRAQLATGKKVVLNVDPNTSSDTEAIVRAVTEAGGYVVTQWNKPDGLHPWDVSDNWVAHISFDGRVSGHDIAQVLFDKLGGSGGIIAIQGILDNTTSQQRFAGLEKALEENPGIELLDAQTGNWDRNEGFQVTQTLLTKHGDKIKGIWAANDNMALGALEALRAAGLEGKVFVVGVDAVPEAIEAVQNAETTGYLATVSSDAFWQGGAALALAYRAATGEFDVANAPQEEREFFGTQFVVTQENVGDFTKTPTLADLQADFENPFARSTGQITY